MKGRIGIFLSFFLVVGFLVLLFPGQGYPLPYIAKDISGEATYTNSEPLSISVAMGDNAYVHSVWCVYDDGTTPLDSFENTEAGSIDAEGVVGGTPITSMQDVAEVEDIIGLYVDGGSVTTFTNAGEISAHGQAGSAQQNNSSVGVTGIYAVDLNGGVGTFENPGTITTRAEAGDAGYVDTDQGINNEGHIFIDEIYGIYVGGDSEVTSFTNAGTISSSVSPLSSGGLNAVGDGSLVEVGNVSTPSSIYGAKFDTYVGEFTNSGDVSASVTVGSAQGDGSHVSVVDVYGVYFGDGVGTFTNTDTGAITASATAGDAEGDSSEVLVDNLYGVYVQGSVENTFTNSGSIGVSAQAGNAHGAGSTVKVGDVTGIALEGGVSGINGFDNTGSIGATVVLGNAEGNATATAVTDYESVSTEVDAFANPVYGVYLNGGATTFTNSEAGSISVAAQVGSASGDAGATANAFISNAHAEVDAHAGGVLGVGLAYGTVETFTNEGSIHVGLNNAGSLTPGVQVGDASGDATATASYFNSADANVSSYATEVWGVGLFKGTVETFENTETGNIYAGVQVGNASGDATATSSRSGSYSDAKVSAYASGVWGVFALSGSINDFTNAGSIMTQVDVGDASGDAVASASNGGVAEAHVTASASGIGGIYTYQTRDSFTNQGQVNVEVSVGDALGSVSVNGSDTSASVLAEASSIYGVYFKGGVSGTFTNSGTVSADVQVGNARGDGSLVKVETVKGADFEGGVDTFTDEAMGSISASVQAGNAGYVDTDQGINNEGHVFIDEIYGIYVGGDSEVTSFTNAGTISSSVSPLPSGGLNAVGDGSSVEVGSSEIPQSVYGIKFDSYVEEFTNSGDVSASVTVGSAQGDDSHVSVVDVYGVYFGDGVGTFTNEEAGSISAGVVVGSASGDAVAQVEDNSGNSSYYTDAASVEAYAEGVYGIYVGGDFEGASGDINTTVTNGGSIGSSVVVGSAGGDAVAQVEDNGGDNSHYSATASVEAYAEGVYGIYVGGDFEGASGDINTTVTNGGSIETSVVVGSASGDAVAILGGGEDLPYPFYKGVSSSLNSHAEDVYGVYVEGSVNAITNSNAGSIVTNVNAGGATGDATARTTEGKKWNVESHVVTYLESIYGVGIKGSVGNIANAGSIATRVEAGDTTGDATATKSGGGVWLVDASIATRVREVYGTGVEGSVGAFSNTGSIATNVRAGDASGDATASTTGGYILGPVEAGVITEAGDVYGVGIKGSVGNISNAGSIVANVEAGDASGDATAQIADGRVWILDSYVGSGAYDVYGVHMQESVTQFTNTNSGSISVGVKVGSATGDAMAEETGGYVSGGSEAVSAYVSTYAEGVCGIYADGKVNTFDNEGNINVSATVGDASGNAYTIGDDAIASVTADAADIYGVDLEGGADNFTNSGTISSTVQVGSATGDGASVEVSDVYGAYFSNGVGTFGNSGDILASVTAGDNVSISDVAGVYVEGASGGTLSNTGNIVTQINAGVNPDIEGVVGIKIADSSDTTFTNTGHILLSVDPVQGGGLVANTNPLPSGAGIYVEGSSNIAINSPVRVDLYTDMPDTNIRTLWIKDSSVTLQDKFGIVFGDPGITKRPIYLDNTGSSLDLNGATLVAYHGKDWRLDHPYYLIELNDPSVDEVENTWGGLEDGDKWSNPDIKLTWYGPDRGANSAIIWKYDPHESTADLSIHAVRVVSRNILGVLTSHLMYDKLQWWLSENETNKAPIKVADSGNIATEAGPGLGTLTSKGYRNGFFLFPVYTDVEADDLGYDAHAFGMVMGLERRITNAMTVGLFGGISRSDVKFNDYDNGGKEDDQDLYHLGFYTNYACGHWYASLVAMGYAAQHDYEGRTGPYFDMKETADYWSHGLEAELVGGYAFGDLRSWMVMPELGIGYSYWRVSDYKTDAEDSAWDKHYDSEDDSYVRSIVGLTGLKRWEARDLKVDLMASVKWEQALGDNDISITQSIPDLGSSKRDVEEEVGDTSIIGKAGLSLVIMDRAKLNFTFRSEFNEDYTVYSGRVSLGVSF